MMGLSLKVIICLMTSSVSLLCVTGHEGRLVNNTCNNPPVKHTALPGASVTVHCEYPNTDKIFTRRFCREESPFSCTELISAYSAPVTRKDKYSLTDDKQRGRYTVNVSDLVLEDTGRYRCEADRSRNSSFECLTEIHLQILNWDDIPSNTITGLSGGSIKIDCHYPKVHESNEKFLCKGQSPISCEELIQTKDGDRDVSKGQFKIRDNRRKNYFFVYISNPSTADSGTYWCGSDRTWQQAQINKTRLTVVDKTKGLGFPAPSAKEDQSSLDEHLDNTEHDSSDESSDIGLIGGVAGCLALLLILGVVLILFRLKLFRTQVCCPSGGSSDQVTNTGQNTEGNPGEPHNEEIQMQNQQASSGDALQAVYVTVNLAADQVHYASVNFKKDPVNVSTDGDALPDLNRDGCSACDDSSVSSQGLNHRTAAGQTIYSTVARPWEP
uniref:CMRF35-like molecule 8 isoform X2 n=1 Tax=Semicossyphus pulcher TaxID=241346 RepID=UPI0037E93ECB